MSEFKTVQSDIKFSHSVALKKKIYLKCRLFLLNSLITGKESGKMVQNH